MEKSEKVLLISNIILVGFVLAVIFHYILGSYLNSDYPFNTFLDNPTQAFSDFTETLTAVKNFAPYTVPDSWTVYLPLAYIFLFPLSFIKNKFISYLVFAFGFFIPFAYINFKKISCNNLTKIQNFQNIFIICFLSYPVLLILDRGNYDMLLFFIFAGFIYTFKSKRYLLSGILLAIENAMKPFSILFLFLFLFKRRYKEFFVSIILTILFIIGGFMFLQGGFFNEITVYIKSLMLFKYAYVYHDGNSQLTIHSSSLFIPLKLMLCVYNKVFSTLTLEKIYNYIYVIISSMILFFAWREKIFWKQIALLTLHMLFLPYVIIDYKLIFLFVPLWLFIQAKEKSKIDFAYVILFGLLLVPKNIVLLSSPHYPTGWFSISIIINPILIMIFMGLIIFEQFYKKLKEEN